jgi:methyl-accepting chemotaxis protein
MKWFYNLKTAVKLISAFVLVGLILAFVGLYGLTNMGKISDGLSSMYHNNLNPVADLSSVQILYQRIRVNIRDMNTLASSKEENDKYQETINGFKRDIEAKMETYNKMVSTKEEQEQ